MKKKQNNLSLVEFINNWKNKNERKNTLLNTVSCSDDYKKEISSNINFKLDENNLEQALWCFINNLKDIPVCPICGNSLKFLSINKGFNKFCSSSCRNKYNHKNGNFNLKIQNVKNNYTIDELKYFFDGRSSYAYKHIYNSLQKFIDELYPNILLWSEKVYMLINDIKEPPICNICNKNYKKFNKFSKGYHDTCCKDGCNVKLQHKLSDITCETKYGYKCSLKNKDVRTKYENTMIKKYGAKNPSLCDDICEKRRSHFNEKYGSNSPFSDKSVQDKYKETCIKRYGVDHPWKSFEVRSKIAKNLKISKLEKKLIEVLTNNNINFKHQYTIKNEFGIHTFDFAIFDNNNTLVCLIDCDGIYFHGYLSDANGKSVRDEYDVSRVQQIPIGIKFIVIIESHFEEGIKELFSVLNFDYDKYIQDIFDWCRSIKFPYPNYNDDALKTSWKQLCNYESFLPKSRIGDKLIRNFHPSIYHAKVSKLSPFEAWQQDDLLIKVIKNRFIYKNNIDPSRVLDGFNIAKIAPKVSVFQPSLAKTLIQKYLNEFNEIYDPFSGFSGRMLGACSLGKKYIGIDLNEIHIEESNEIIKFLNLNNVKIKQSNILKEEGEYECLFTCPPYGNKESWNKGEIVKSADEWIDECLKRFKCQSYLFVVDKTEKYKEFIVEELENKSHFGKNNEQVIQIKKGDQVSF